MKKIHKREFKRKADQTFRFEEFSIALPSIKEKVKD